MGDVRQSASPGRATTPSTPGVTEGAESAGSGASLGALASPRSLIGGSRLLVAPSQMSAGPSGLKVAAGLVQGGAQVPM